MNSTRPVSVISAGATLGEGPVWDAAAQALWFVDIKQCKIHRFAPASGQWDRWKAPAQTGWIFPAGNGAYIAGLQTGIHRFLPEQGSFTLLADPEPDLPDNRLNDATVAPDGRIWFGTMDDRESAPTGRLYSFDGTIVCQAIDAVPISNGPAFSPDGGTLYYVDTLGCVIWSVDVTDARVGAQRIFARIEAGAGHPDGPTVDAEGNVWVGLFGGWAVRCYAPDGTLREEVPFPVANITKIAFGDHDLRTVYATTARVGLEEAALVAQPEAGDVFAFRTSAPGVPLPQLLVS